jgi:hypothetical protein
VTSEFTTTLHDTLAGYVLPDESDTYFGKVFVGEPNALAPVGKPVARWKIARTEQPPEGARNLKGRRMVACVFHVNCYWPLSGTEGSQANTELSIGRMLIDLPTKFIALEATDYTIGGYAISGLTVEDVSSVERLQPFLTSEAEMRVATFEIHARVLEA